jgi:DNA-binding LacI/PurR family transcriptional regulator
MGVTIYDLAREAGVGIGTVSRCLNDHPSVSPHTRERVLGVVKRLNYQPHTHARRLASKRTNTIAAIIPFFTNYFSAQVLQGVQDKASELDIDLILYGVNHPMQVEEYLHRSLQRGHVDGVLFFSMRFPESYVARFHQLRVPVVFVDAYHREFDSIRVENREGAMIATRHLIGLGHRNIAMLNASLESQPAQDRLDGFRAAMAEANLPCPLERIIVAGIGKQDGYSRESGATSMRQLLPALYGNDPVTAVLVASDIQAIGAIEVAREAGVRIPDDLALVSFDDIELAQHAGLTTMRQPMYQMGLQAIERLTVRMADPEGAVSLTTFHPDLVIRDTCGQRLLSFQDPRQPRH